MLGGVSAQRTDSRRLVDTAYFTITPKKITQDPNFVQNVDAAITAIKQSEPELKAVPLLAIYEYPEQEQPIPSPAWIQEVGDGVLATENLDGMHFFPWSPSSYMGDTIEDVASDPAYQAVFRDLFGRAEKRF